MTGEQWHIPIIGHDVVDPSSLLANPRNYRIHPTHQKNALQGAINDVGFIRSVTVNVRTNYVLDGHLRVALALQTGQQVIPVEYVDIPEEREAEALATFDPIAALAVVDKQQFASLLEDVHSGDAAVQEMLANLAEVEGITPPDFEPVGIDEQGRLDEKAKVTCPECGHEFAP